MAVHLAVGLLGGQRGCHLVDDGSVGGRVVAAAVPHVVVVAHAAHAMVVVGLACLARLCDQHGPLSLKTLRRRQIFLRPLFAMLS